MNDMTEFRAPTSMDMRSIEANGYGMVQYGPTDDRLIVGFYRKSVLNQARSREAGKPVFEGKDFVKIQHPGETLNVLDQPVREDHKQRWPQKWAQYQSGINQIPDGVPINLLFPTRPEIESTLRSYNIHTVEQLAGLSAHAISTVGMGAQDWVNAAQRYMERADKGVNHHQFEKALADKDTQIRALQRQVEEVTALVRQQQAPAAPNAAHPFDAQTSQINAVHQSGTDPFTPGPAQFVQDLSGQVQPQRRGPGRPRKTQEH